MTIKAGDVVSLASPITFGTVDANGAPVVGMSLVTSEVVILKIEGPVDEGGTAFVAPVANFDTALLGGASVLNG